MLESLNFTGRELLVAVVLATVVYLFVITSYSIHYTKLYEKRLQPLMKDIREKYKNDKKKMNEEVRGLYRTYKINPLGGCLPMVVQLPVFFVV